MWSEWKCGVNGNEECVEMRSVWKLGICENKRCIELLSQNMN